MPGVRQPSHGGCRLAQPCTAGQASIGRHREWRTRDFEEKETRRWRDGYRIAAEAARACPATSVISVGDREADMFELLLEAEQNTLENVHFVIRARHNRCLDERDVAVGGAVYAKMYARLAEQEPRIKRLPHVSLWCVYAKEIDPPPGAEPLEWHLLTDLPCRTLEEAVAALQYYATRWQIEVFFRVLKTGCKVEQLQFERLDRLQPCLAVYMIATWRILNVMMLGRHCPDLPRDVLLTESEWKAAWQVRRRRPPPASPPTLGEMITILSSLGGHLGRKCDGPPGPKSIWIGLHRTMDFALAWNAFGPASPAQPP